MRTLRWTVARRAEQTWACPTCYDANQDSRTQGLCTGWVICRFTLCCVSKNRNKGLILCTTMCYSCQVAYRSELSQTARISLLVYERNSCRASSFQCIYPCFNKSFINGWVLSETQNGMFTKNAATVLAQFWLNSVWLSKWHTAKHEKENVRLFRKCEKSLKVLKATKCDTIVNHSHASI